MIEIPISTEALGNLFVGAVGAVLTLVFQKLVSWWRRPILQIECDTGAGFRVPRASRDRNGNTLSLIWLRVRVRNTGRSPAKSVRLFVTRYGELGRESEERERLATDPAALYWSHSNHMEDTNDRLVASLSPKSHRFVDFLVACDEQYPRLQLNSPTDDGQFLDSAIRLNGGTVEFMAVTESGESSVVVAAFAWEGNSTSLNWLPQKGQ